MPVQDSSDNPFRRKDTLIEKLHRNWKYLEDAPDELRADKDVVLAAISNNWAALEMALEPLRSDRDFNSAIVRQNGCALQYVIEPLRADRDLVLAAVREHWAALQYADASLQNDREIVVQAMEQSHVALKFASPALQGERDQLLKEAGYGKDRDPYVDRGGHKGAVRKEVDANQCIVQDICIQKGRSGSSKSQYVHALYGTPRFAKPVLKGLVPAKESLASDSQWHSRRIDELRERTMAMREAHDRLPLSQRP